jgi:hypothetical protein
MSMAGMVDAGDCANAVNGAAPSASVKARMAVYLLVIKRILL